LRLLDQDLNCRVFEMIAKRPDFDVFKSTFPGAGQNTDGKACISHAVFLSAYRLILQALASENALSAFFYP